MITASIEVSARHLHLTAADWRRLFGRQRIRIDRGISQKPQFIAVQRLTVAGPKGRLEHVGIVGPFRPYTQFELSGTDAHRLGIAAPVAASGDHRRAAKITIIGPAGRVTRRAAIRPQRHLHISDRDARRYGMKNNTTISVLVSGPRGGLLHHVLVRSHANYLRRVHLDTDEGNALGVTAATKATLVKHG